MHSKEQNVSKQGENKLNKQIILVDGMNTRNMDSRIFSSLNMHKEL